LHHEVALALEWLVNPPRCTNDEDECTVDAEAGRDAGDTAGLLATISLLCGAGVNVPP